MMDWAPRAFARRVVLLAITLLAPSVASASGWNDYELEIAPGFTVFRANTFDVCLGTSDQELLICPERQIGRVGPLAEYAVTPSSIFTRHLGVRAHPDNPIMFQGAPEQQFFFATDRTTREIHGPMSLQQLEASAPPDLDWQVPRNPNFWTPLIGSVLFLVFYLVFAAVYFGWPLLFIAAPLLGYWLFTRARRRAHTP